MPEVNNKIFVCQRCTACCCWPAEVRLDDAAITRIAAFKGLTESDFIQQFTRINRFRHGLALEEKPDGICIFLEEKICAIQPVKPRQCREFPNGWNFPEFERACKAWEVAQTHPSPAE